MTLLMTKVGELPPKKFYIGVCVNCKSEYRAEESDLYHEVECLEHYWSTTCKLKGCSATVYFEKESLR